MAQIYYQNNPFIIYQPTFMSANRISVTNDDLYTANFQLYNPPYLDGTVDYNANFINDRGIGQEWMNTLFFDQKDLIVNTDYELQDDYFSYKVIGSKSGGISGVLDRFSSIVYYLGISDSELNLDLIKFLKSFLKDNFSYTDLLVFNKFFGLDVDLYPFIGRFPEVKQADLSEIEYINEIDKYEVLQRLNYYYSEHNVKPELKKIILWIAQLLISGFTNLEELFEFYKFVADGEDTDFHFETFTVSMSSCDDKFLATSISEEFLFDKQKMKEILEQVLLFKRDS